MFKQFENIEIGFLAWCYGKIANSTGRERFEMTTSKLREEWEDLTGEELPSNFHKFAIDVHDAQ